MKRRGFTLVEILTVIMILAVLAAIAVPSYEKAIERSHIAEARTVLKQMLESKLRTLDSMGRTSFTEGASYTAVFGVGQLDMSLKCPEGGGGTNITCQTKDFRYTLLPNRGVALPSGVKLLNQNGEECNGANECFQSYNLAVCAARCGGEYHNTSFLYLGELTTSPEKMFCYGTREACNLYGMNSNGNGAWCTCD